MLCQAIDAHASSRGTEAQLRGKASTWQLCSGGGRKYRGRYGCRPVAPGVASDTGQQLVEVERLGEVIGRTLGEQVLGGTRTGGHQHDRNGRKMLALEVLPQLDSGHMRHEHAEQDQ